MSRGAAAISSHSLSSQLSTAQLARRWQQVTAHEIRQSFTSSLVHKVLQVTLGDIIVMNHVKPVGKAVSTFRNLQLNSTNSRVVVGRVKIASLQGRSSIWHDNSADKSIRIGSPSRGGSYRITDSVSLNPACRLRLVASRVNLTDQRVSPRLRIGERAAADQFLGHIGIPVGMEVVAITIKSNLDAVSPNLVRLIVQGLSDISQEVDQELESFSDMCSAEAAVACPLGVVCNRRDGAARATAVASVVYVAAGGRIVLRIDEVKRRGPLASGCCAVLVSPGGDVGQVGTGSVPKNTLSP